MSTLVHDLRHAVRVLLRSPSFTAIAVLTLALGIGGSTAIFSLAGAVLLGALPFREAERLVRTFSADEDRPGVPRVAVLSTHG